MDAVRKAASDMNLQSWLKHAPPKVNRALRYVKPGIVAYYWNGGAPKENLVRDVSATGAYVYTAEKWCVGTIIWIAFQQQASNGNASSSVPTITLPCRVVRDGPDGFGVNFIVTEHKKRKAVDRFIQEAIANHGRPSQHEIHPTSSETK